MSDASIDERLRSITNDSEDEAQSLHRWLLTYSDMITLLLALFVVLYALSSLNFTKYAQFAKGLDASLNNGTSHPSSVQTKPTTKVPANKAAPTAASLSSLEVQLHNTLKNDGLINDVQLNLNARGLVLGLVTGKAFYSIDSATLSPIGAQVVNITGNVLRSHTNLVNVDGYTDNEPIHGGPYRDNWQLSAERSVVVVERLQNVAHVDPTRLFVVGLGQYHPVVPNDSIANKARNRRVDIVITPPGDKVTLP